MTMHIVRFALCVVLQVYTVNLVSKIDNESLYFEKSDFIFPHS